MDPVRSASKIDWIWFYLWRHEGRRARHADSMHCPDYTRWHGACDLARHFYTRMMPEHLVEKGRASGDPGKAKAADALQARLGPKEKARRKKAADEFRAGHSK